ncbi:hypothetical protein IQ07DRAFT_557981 [Pyrenochaeta sp. DS3sAY3a]|nr:hypothetical protein IQ07DRAFT_557981 [Pyrenochaeta sp. DS3sAY3a]
MTSYDDYGIPVGAYSEPESLTVQAWRVARAFYLYRIRPLAERRAGAVKRGNWSIKRGFTLVRALVLVWWVVLYWGERGVFNGAVESCSWERWEKWEEGANPHRLIFVADPQLIDPHTYPGRPWPLNPLTYKYTDLYLRRTYSRLQTVLYPDTIFFLGDLFDGGREWSTRTTTSPEAQYRKYGDDFWMNEYRRFGDLFFKHWGDGGMDARAGQRGRKLISSLPGNHDLGFARGVQVGVRDRFNAYFGDGNRIDVIANHTFVSIDSVSLSALGQDSPQQVENLWRPTTDFLENAKKQKRRLIQRDLRIQQGLRPYPGFDHRAIDSDELSKATLPHAEDDVTEYPTILLSHVPLYRAQGTPCGPQREHWPPTPQAPGEDPLERDDRNAISVRGGYQYQNVLNREISADIAEKIGDIRYAFSGDDHDYCEVLHRGYTSGGGGIREITVKSISWAMGVRLPGVVLVSLWNPVDAQGTPLSGSASKTLQTHLCLLPDQIGTFLTYALLFGLTLLLLCIRAALVTAGVLASPSSTPSSHTTEPLLPTSAPAGPGSGTSSAEHEKALQQQQHALAHTADAPHSAHSSTSSDRSAGLLVRGTQARTRTGSPGSGAQGTQSQATLSTAGQKYSFPLVQHAGYFEPKSDSQHVAGSSDGSSDGTRKPRIYGASSSSSSSKREPRPRKRRRGIRLFWYEVRTSLGVVLVLGGGVYGGLVWLG